MVSAHRPRWVCVVPLAGFCVCGIWSYICGTGLPSSQSPVSSPETHSWVGVFCQALLVTEPRGEASISLPPAPVENMGAGCQSGGQAPSAQKT